MRLVKSEIMYKKEYLNREILQEITEWVSQKLDSTFTHNYKIDKKYILDSIY